MDISNVEKGSNNGQMIVTLKDGSTENLTGLMRIKVSQNIITIKDPATRESYSLNFDDGSLNKQGQASAQALVNFWFDNDFFLRRQSGSVTLETPNVDVESSTITVAGQYTPTKTFSKILDVQVSNVPIDLNRITFDGTTITFLDGATVDETVKVIGTLSTANLCTTLSAGPLSPIASGAAITINSGNLSDYNNVFNEFSASSSVPVTLPPITDVSEGDQMQFVIPETSPAATRVTLAPNGSEQINFNGDIISAPNVLEIGRTTSPSLGRDSAHIRRQGTVWIVCATEGIVTEVSP